MKTLAMTLVIVFLVVFAVCEARDSVVNFSVENNFCKLVFKDCGSVLGKMLSVSFNGTCNSQGWAVLKKGTVIQIDYQFVSYKSEAVLKSVVEGKMGIFPWVHFPFSNPNACVNSGLVCPIQANTTVDYLPLLSILSTYPAVNVIVKWELQNQSGDDVFCVVLPATITD